MTRRSLSAAVFIFSISCLAQLIFHPSTHAQTDPQRAEILLNAIEKRLEVKEAEPGDVDSSDVQRLAAWVAEQKQS